MIRNVVGFYFSPSGNTAAITKKITSSIAENLVDTCVDEINVSTFDLLEHAPADEIALDEDSIAVIGMPCYTGRVPLPCIKLLKKLRGNNTLTIALTTYGNSTYGDSLYELCTFAEEQGFVVAGAATFIVQHPMFNKIGENRPDAEDYAMIDTFSHLVSKKIRKYTCTTVNAFRHKPAPLEITGSMPSRSPFRIPIHPSSNACCVACGACAKICPVNAISITDVNVTNPHKCISCTSCIKVCEHNARGFQGPMALASKLALEKLYARRKNPEWFL